MTIGRLFGLFGGLFLAAALPGQFSGLALSAQARRLFVALLAFRGDDGHGGLMRGPDAGLIDGSCRHDASRRAEPMLPGCRSLHRRCRTPAHISWGSL